MGLVKVVDKSIIEETIRRAENSARGRAASILDPHEKEGIRTLVHAIRRNCYIRPHFHESDEAFAILTGKLDVIFFDEGGNVKEKYRMDDKGGMKLVGIPKKIYHNVISLDSCSTMLAISVGPYNPTKPKNFASWSPEEPKDGMEAYGLELHNFMKVLYQEKS